MDFVPLITDITDSQFDQIISIIAMIVTFALGRMTLQPGYSKFKNILNNAKGLTDEVAEALVDDKITDEEFKRIFNRLHLLIDTGKVTPK
jgi:hypothetical protein